MAPLQTRAAVEVDDAELAPSPSPGLNGALIDYSQLGGFTLICEECVSLLFFFLPLPASLSSIQVAPASPPPSRPLLPVRAPTACTACLISTFANTGDAQMRNPRRRLLSLGPAATPARRRRAAHGPRRRVPGARGAPARLATRPHASRRRRSGRSRLVPGGAVVSAAPARPRTPTSATTPAATAAAKDEHHCRCRPASQR